MQIPVVFALEISAIITIVILLISFLGWLANLANEKKQKPAAAPPGERGAKPRPRNREIQSEIDRFLEEVGTKPQQRKPPRQAVPIDDDVFIEVVPDRELRERHSERIAQSGPPVLDPLGSDVRQHVRTHMRERIDDIVQRDLDSQVDEGVIEHLGSPMMTPADQLRPTTPAAGRLADILRSRDGLRQAILVNEVLSPPLSRRPPRTRSPSQP